MVAIILIIAAIAIPNLLRARIAANESSAASSVRSIATAEITYNAAYPTLGYAAALANLGGPATGCTPSSVTACLIDNVLSSGAKSGYAFKASRLPSGSGGINDRLCGSSAPVGVQSDGRPQLLHNHGWSLAQQSGRLGRIAGPRRSHLPGLRHRAIINGLASTWGRVLRHRGPGPESWPFYFRNAAYSARHSRPSPRLKYNLSETQAQASRDGSCSRHGCHRNSRLGENLHRRLLAQEARSTACGRLTWPSKKARFSAFWDQRRGQDHHAQAADGPDISDRRHGPHPGHGN